MHRHVDFPTLQSACAFPVHRRGSMSIHAYSTPLTSVQDGVLDDPCFVLLRIAELWSRSSLEGGDERRRVNPVGWEERGRELRKVLWLNPIVRWTVFLLHRVLCLVLAGSRAEALAWWDQITGVQPGSFRFSRKPSLSSLHASRRERHDPQHPSDHFIARSESGPVTAMRVPARCWSSRLAPALRRMLFVHGLWGLTARSTSRWGWRGRASETRFRQRLV